MVNGDGLVPIFHLLLCFTGGKYKEGMENIWEMKGEIPYRGIPMLVKLIPLHFALNTSLQGTYRAEFEMHVNSLSSVHPQDFDATSHQVAAVEDEGSCIVRPLGLVFVLTDVA